MNNKNFLCIPFYFTSKNYNLLVFDRNVEEDSCCLLLRTAEYARQLVSFISSKMLNWLKSGKLSSGTSHDKVDSQEGGEGPRDIEDLEATETERITDQREENEREADDAPEEEEGRRWQKRGDEGEHQTVKKEENMMKIIWVWASLGSAVQIAQSLSAWCAVGF